MTMHDAQIDRVAAVLAQAADSKVPAAPIRSLLAEGDITAAYAVQTVNAHRALVAGHRLVGRKIGLTSAAAQKQLGVNQPDYGMLFSDMARGDGEDISLADVMQPKVAAEIAYVLDGDLLHEPLTTADLYCAIAYAIPAIEIAASRIAGWDISITDTIADNASAGLYVLGSRPVRLTDFDPQLCGMVMERAGEPVSVGAGLACLGSPLNAALWLANVMVKAGTPLRAGDTILTGALGPMVEVAAGDVFDVRIEGLGTVRAAFAHA